MRYRIKELHGSVVIKIDGRAREDEAARARRGLSPFPRTAWGAQRGESLRGASAVASVRHVPNR